MWGVSATLVDFRSAHACVNFMLLLIGRMELPILHASPDIIAVFSSGSLGSACNFGNSQNDDNGIFEI